MSLRQILSTLFQRDANAALQKKLLGPDSPNIDETQSIPEPELDRELVIVDAGCRWGFANKFTGNQNRFRIYGFDPAHEECQRLARQYEGKAVSLFPVGLAGSSGKRTLYVTQEPACSSLLLPDPKLTEIYPALHCARHVSSIEVETITLDEWARNNSVHVIDYIKLDTQGTELEILKGGINALKNVRSIEIEVEFNPIYLGQPIFSDVDLFLRNEGFVLWKLTNQVHYSKNGPTEAPLGEDVICYNEKHRVRHNIFGGQLYWANAHYVRKCILEAEESTGMQKLRDIALFRALDMPDVVSHFQAFSCKKAGE